MCSSFGCASGYASYHLVRALFFVRVRTLTPRTCGAADEHCDAVRGLDHRAPHQLFGHQRLQGDRDGPLHHLQPPRRRSQDDRSQLRRLSLSPCPSAPNPNARALSFLRTRTTAHVPLQSCSPTCIPLAGMPSCGGATDTMPSYADGTWTGKWFAPTAMLQSPHVIRAVLMCCAPRLSICLLNACRSEPRSFTLLLRNIPDRLMDKPELQRWYRVCRVASCVVCRVSCVVCRVSCVVWVTLTSARLGSRTTCIRKWWTCSSSTRRSRWIA